MHSYQEYTKSWIPTEECYILYVTTVIYFCMLTPARTRQPPVDIIVDSFIVYKLPRDFGQLQASAHECCSADVAIKVEVYTMHITYGIHTGPELYPL